VEFHESQFNASKAVYNDPCMMIMISFSTAGFSGARPVLAPLDLNQVDF
jgi:hypothetical protein